MSVRILSRFCGPDNSSNGGYCCGLLGRCIPGSSEVRLLRPPPLDTDMEIAQQDGELILLLRGEPVAVARPCRLEGGPLPASPTLAQARAARGRYSGLHAHTYPRCFVCGPERSPAEALCLYTGTVEGRDLVACDWLPNADLLDDRGKVRTEFVWSALDCPGFFALGQPLGGDRLFLLGQLAVEIRSPVAGDEPLVVYAWKRGVDGRKYFSASAIATAGGEVLARSEQVWIELRNRVPARACEYPDPEPGRCWRGSHPDGATAAMGTVNMDYRRVSQTGND